MNATKPVDADKVTLESAGVHSYLTILQSLIVRMGTNSSNCKNWCVSLVCAIVVVVADKGRPNHFWIAIVPIAPFLLLDSYYVFLERHFRSVYNNFIRKLHFGTASVGDVLFIAPRAAIRTTSWNIANAGGSIAVWPSYALLAAMLVVVKTWILA
jgi:hypothetical protein